jgi:hypothetical protein
LLTERGIRGYLGEDFFAIAARTRLVFSNFGQQPSKCDLAMYRLFLALVFVLIGCQQGIPPTASALTDADIAQIQAEITELSSAIMEHFAKVEGVIDFYGN